MQSSGDATIQVHSDALKYVQSARETQNVVLDDNIYRLLMKNVSRNDPLTREEAQVVLLKFNLNENNHLSL